MRYTLILFLVYITSYAQTGVINYGEIQSLGMGGSYGPDYNSILIFNKEKSLYITRKDSLEGSHIWEQRSYKNGDGNQSSITVVTNPKGFQYFYDLKEKNLYSRDLGFKFVKDKTINIPWKILAETKSIGDYTVQKATASFRGRDYTAWFTTQIPLPFGPWKLSGLPGIILEAYDTHKEIYWYFKNIEYPSKKHNLLKPIKAPNNSWMTFDDFKKFSIETYLEAQINGRIVVENAGFSNNDNVQQYDMTKSRIEAFKIEQ